MRILITGANGQLGQALKNSISSFSQFNTLFTDIDTLDITDEEAVDRVFANESFDVVVNCAGYTAVDKAETDHLNAGLINTDAVRNIAKAAANHNVRVIHISTDYVFSGENHRPYSENDEPYPTSIYGRTKLEGEGVLRAFAPNSIIIRTAWLYSEFGHNFVKTILRLAGSKNEISVVCDQIGTPTYASDLADAIVSILLNDTWKPGIYHFTDEGVASWYDFAMAITELSHNKEIKINPVPTSEYPSVAKRPLFSVLNKQKIKTTFNLEIPYWRDSLRKCLNKLS